MRIREGEFNVTTGTHPWIDGDHVEDYAWLFPDIYIWDCCRVGSRVTCRPAPTDTDDDRLLLITDHDELAAHTQLEKSGFLRCGGEGTAYAFPDDHWSAWRKGELNIILTTSEEFFDRFIMATKMCAHLNLLKREDRVTLFRISRDEEVPTLLE